jgi:2-haloacid dehalogenase
VEGAGAAGGREVLAFDCVGASAAGMRTAWVNRSAAPFDTIGAQPDVIVPALDRLPAALGG